MLATRSVRRSPWRALLTGIGIVIGVASITLTVATGEGERRAMMAGWKAMVGSMDLLFVSPGGKAQRGMASMQNSIATLKADDALAIQGSVPNVKAVGMQQSEFRVPIESGGKNGTTALLGVTPEWNAQRGDRVAAGRFLNEQDQQTMARVALIGVDVARTYFPNAQAVGQRLRISGVEFEVVGVLETLGAGPGGASMDNLIYVPLATSSRRVFNRDFLSSIQVKLNDVDRAMETQAAVEALLRQRHSIARAELDDFRVINPMAMVAQQRSVDSSLRRNITLVGILALLLGGVLVANLMYAATLGRTREIGMRRAVGATRRDILQQFWVEGVATCAFAGIVGAAVSLLLIAGSGRFIKAPLAVSWPVTLGAVAATAGIGLIAGYFPARRAAGLAPAEVLRTQQ